MASDGELPLAAFSADDVTSNVDATIPPDAFPDEPTRTLGVGEYELVDEDEERTRVLRPLAAPEGREVTRVAGAGELPLAELEREVEADAERDLDALLESMEPASPSEPVVPAAPLFDAPKDAPALSADPVHAPLDEDDVASAAPEASAWAIHEPGEDDDDGAPPLGFGERSWPGVRVREEPPTFAPGTESVDADTWGEADAAWDDDEPTFAISPAQLEAESLVQRGELGEALRVYQELAAERPDDPALWDRIAEIARMLQARSRGEQ